MFKSVGAFFDKSLSANLKNNPFSTGGLGTDYRELLSKLQRQQINKWM